ncbi:MAG: ATP-binding cassette domain-containing protein [Lentisphaerae bacterium]|nr:ATP-binding cassette domain-containing protein [Lentisphaerota bacterium]
MTPPHAIDIEDLTLAFGERTVLDGFSLHVRQGETVILAGPSGSGKSSLLACLLGFLSPVSGRIAIRNESLGPKSVWRLRRHMALVQQEPDLGESTVLNWIEEPFTFRANEALRGNLSRLPDLLRRLRLNDSILSQTGPHLSGGEKQRVALAAALLLDRPILLLDEPASALDPDSREAVYACLAGLQDMAVLMVSHDTPAALDFAGRTVRLSPPEVPHGRP